MSMRELISQLIEATERAQTTAYKGSIFDSEWAGFKNIEGFGSLNMSREMNRIVREISVLLYDADKSFWRSWAREDWFRIVDRTLIPLIAKSNPSHDRETAVADIVRNLTVELEQQKSTRPISFIFGCYLFAEDIGCPVKFGKLSFWPRVLWLDEQVKLDRISQAVHHRLKARWQAQPDISDGNDLSEFPEDEAVEASIMGAIGPCTYVCEVTTDGLSGRSAQSKALMAMRFGLAGIALTWETPSKALENMPSLFDGLSRIQENAVVAGGRVRPGGIHRTGGNGQHLIDTNWEKIERDYREIFGTITDVITCLLDAKGDIPRAKLMDALAHSLLWFHEACREDLPMVAVTKYIAALDALASGSGGAAGIVNVAAARFNMGKDDPIRPNGPSLNTALTDLYSQGRSRLLHGSSDRLMHDWEASRNLAESLARHALVCCLDWAASNPECDDPKAMAKR